MPVSALSFTVEGEPVAFARAGANGTRRYTPPKQDAWKRACAYIARSAMKGQPPATGPVHLAVVATFAIPRSWSKARRAAAHWHISTPDGDNVLKEVADALKGIAWADDAQVARWSIEKVYGEWPDVAVTVTPLLAP